MELEVLGDKQQQTKHYIDHVIKYCNKVEDTILQNDISTQVEEKLASIGIATVFMWLVGIFLTFTGAGIVLFIVGLILSRIINAKIYGKPRNIEKLKEEEKVLLEYMHSYLKQLRGIKMKVGIASKRNQSLFVDYPLRKVELLNLTEQVNSLNIQHLSIKYRTVYSKFNKSHSRLTKHLNNAYQINGRDFYDF
tara:strand:- start:4077 stop:4655 length:579 start_codon:yes stop_codon:yes gene_type:complete